MGRKKVIKVNTKRIEDEFSKVKEVPLHLIIIKTGARDYGAPLNATEIRM